MPRFYFTYGTDERYPFQGGWTEIEAPDLHSACQMFRIYHPDKTEGLLNCASFYSEEQFNSSDMPVKGNFDKFCVERILREVNTWQK